MSTVVSVSPATIGWVVVKKTFEPSLEAPWNTEVAVGSPFASEHGATLHRAGSGLEISIVLLASTRA